MIRLESAEPYMNPHYWGHTLGNTDCAERTPLQHSPIGYLSASASIMQHEVTGGSRRALAAYTEGEHVDPYTLGVGSVMLVQRETLFRARGYNVAIDPEAYDPAVAPDRSAEFVRAGDKHSVLYEAGRLWLGIGQTAFGRPYPLLARPGTPGEIMDWEAMIARIRIPLKPFVIGETQHLRTHKGEFLARTRSVIRCGHGNGNARVRMPDWALNLKPRTAEA